MDVERRVAHRVSFGLEEYISIAASADGRRLVATVSNPNRKLWTAPISDQIAEESSVRSFPLPTVSAVSPRFGPDYLLYLSSKGGANGLWKFKNGAVRELWKATEGALAAAPAVSPDGRQICFSIRKEGRARLYLMSADGTNLRALAESLDVRDTSSWSPDGKWIVVAANEGQANPLFKVAADGGPVIRLMDGVLYNPVWSPDGQLIVYTEAVQGASYRVNAITPEKQPVSLPELWVRTDGNRYRFMPNGKSVVIMQGKYRRQDFWSLDLATGRLRQLTKLQPGSSMRSFDISPDGRQIVFDRVRENSDLVLIDLARP